MTMKELQPASSKQSSTCVSLAAAGGVVSVLRIAASFSSSTVTPSSEDFSPATVTGNTPFRHLIGQLPPGKLWSAHLVRSFTQSWRALPSQLRSSKNRRSSFAFSAAHILRCLCRGLADRSCSRWDPHHTSAFLIASLNADNTSEMQHVTSPIRNTNREDRRQSLTDLKLFCSDLTAPEHSQSLNFAVCSNQEGATAFVRDKKVPSISEQRSCVAFDR